MTGKSRTLILIVAFIMMVLGLFTYKVIRTQAEPEIQALIYPNPKTLPEFTMTAHSNTEFGNEQLLGKWSVVFFGFTFCPDICPTTMAGLSEMANNLPPDVYAKTQFIFVTVDPERDTVDKLAEYIPFYHEDFIATVGTPEQLEIFSKSLGAVYVKVPFGDTYQMQHTGRIFIINPQGQRFGIFAEDHTRPGILDVPTMVSDLTYIVRNH